MDSLEPWLYCEEYGVIVERSRHVKKVEEDLKSK